MNKLFLLPIMLTFGCHVPPPKQVGYEPHYGPQATVKSSGTSTICSVSNISEAELNVSCSFRNNLNTIYNPCVEFAFFKRYEDQSVGELPLTCVHGVDPYSTENQTITFSGARANELHASCGDNLVNCYMRTGSQ